MSRLYMTVLSISIAFIIFGCTEATNEGRTELTISDIIELDEPEARSVHEVIVRSDSFDPERIEGKAGDTIIFRSADAERHTIVFDIADHSGDVLSSKGVYEHTIEDIDGGYAFYDSETGGSGIIIVSS